MVVFGQSGFIWVNLVLLGQKWLCLGKSACIWARLLYLGKRGCFRATVVVFGQKW